jgi:hypothetical protein
LTLAFLWGVTWLGDWLDENRGESAGPNLTVVEDTL